MTECSDAAGRRVKLGREIGRGGEGAVYEVAGDPGMVAKIYSDQRDHARLDKLLAMTHAQSDELLKIAAWPVSVLKKPGGRAAVGFLMSKAAGREAHTLYNPKQRQAEFPNADWEFLVCTARNVAAAIDTVHSAGHVIGDINQKGVLVTPNATVRLIDCDSFQINVSGRLFPCLVGVPEFTPPELHGVSYDKIERTKNHDAFGLAVLVFHLLFMGRHPFAGRFSGHGDMELDRAIREFRFAYSQTGATRQMLPPPHALQLSATSFGVASLFERAFAPGSAHQPRPSAAEWTRALDTLQRELKACTVERAHRYHRNLPDCPWCVMERQGGVAFFLGKALANSAPGSPFDLQVVVQAIAALSAPKPPPASPALVPIAGVTPKPFSQNLGRRRSVANAMVVVALVLAGIGVSAGANSVAWTVLVVLGVLWLWVERGGGWKVERETRKRALDAAEKQWKFMVGAWRTERQKTVDSFNQRRSAIDQLAVEYKDLPNKLNQERQALERRREELQRKTFLERHYLNDAKLSGVGPGIKATLASYGVETAYDVLNQSVAVPGVGQARRATLIGWAHAVAAQFRFDPKQGVHATDIAAINHRFAMRMAEIKRLVLTGKAEMEGLLRLSEQQRAEPRTRFDAPARQLAQAKADLSLIRWTQR